MVELVSYPIEHAVKPSFPRIGKRKTISRSSSVICETCPSFSFFWSSEPCSLHGFFGLLPVVDDIEAFARRIMQVSCKFTFPEG